MAWPSAKAQSAKAQSAKAQSASVLTANFLTASVVTASVLTASVLTASVVTASVVTASVLTASALTAAAPSKRRRANFDIKTGGSYPTAHRCLTLIIAGPRPLWLSIFWCRSSHFWPCALTSH